MPALIEKMLSVVLVGVLLQGSLTAQDRTQSPPQTIAKMQRVLQKAQEKGKVVNVSLNKRIDNHKSLSGRVRDISDTGFVVIDQKSGTTTKLAYTDVQRVQQKGLSTPVGIALGLGIVAGIVLALFLALYPKT